MQGVGTDKPVAEGRGATQDAAVGGVFWALPQWSRRARSLPSAAQGEQGRRGITGLMGIPIMKCVHLLVSFSFAFHALLACFLAGPSGLAKQYLFCHEICARLGWTTNREY